MKLGGELKESDESEKERNERRETRRGRVEFRNVLTTDAALLWAEM